MNPSPDSRRGLNVMNAETKTEIETTSCDFHEPYFGASYPDATCIDGYLWDLDSCDEPGGPLSGGGEVPCPQCNHDVWLEDFEDTVWMEGYEAAEHGKPRDYTPSKIRHEQPQDKGRMITWWLAGYDKFIEEKGAAA